ncbi:hypothetical protein CVT26_003500 [Gymnopilus dilepis]|uniref:Uncharacterized protein n=1 Tax=Gymnopilus dilepis TaxID=231916 RepID=A0A409W2X6_9AGAR|nr:hypothetical protein CVT26_003500 [Gymnopilus dilepis]
MEAIRFFPLVNPTPDQIEEMIHIAVECFESVIMNRAMTGDSPKNSEALFRLTFRAAAIEGNIFVCQDDESDKIVALAAGFGPTSKFLGRRRSLGFYEFFENLSEETKAWWKDNVMKPSELPVNVQPSLKLLTFATQVLEQRKGYGSYLMKEIMKVSSIPICVNAVTDSTVLFYRRLGFKTISSSEVSSTYGSWFPPANVAIEYQQDLTTFNGSFDFPSIYRGDPTPQVDDAWFRISTGIRTTRLTLEQLRKIGKEDTLSKVKYQEADGGGYIAAVEFSHQLHCLNLLRKYVHFDYYGQSDPFFTESRPETYQRHLEHCIEALRQALMCSADTGMITFEWVRGFSMPYPDFNTKHRCRDFEKLVAWQTANGVNDVPLDRIVRLNEEVDLIDVP